MLEDQCWKTNFKTVVCSCSGFPTDAMSWINEVEIVESVDDLMTSQSIGGCRCPNLEMLDAKNASALKKIITNPYFKKIVILEEQKAQMQFLGTDSHTCSSSSHSRVLSVSCQQLWRLASCSCVADACILRLSWLLLLQHLSSISARSLSRRHSLSLGTFFFLRC